VPAPGDPDLDAFATQYYAHVPPEELARRTPEALRTAARVHWDLAARRVPGQALVHVFSPKREDGWDARHTIVHIVNDDMPFLVDSVTMELERHGLGLHLVVHPIVRVRRDAEGHRLGLASESMPTEPGLLESYLYIEIDRETDRRVLDVLERDLERVLHDVRAATSDWLELLGRLRRVRDELVRHPPPVDPDDLAESVALLDWMADQHFTFLGARDYDLVRDGEHDVLCPVPGSGLGLLRHAAEVPSRSFAELPPEIRARAREKRLLVLTKANRRSTVHRPTYLDYVGVRRFDEPGEVIGEHRFLGLFTSAAYTSNPVDIPVLRRKVAAVVDRAGLLPGSHDQKDLVAILETYPRDDLFQVGVDELYRTAMGILRLQERRQVRLFVNRETYGRFVSCIVFLPRDRYTTPVRQRVAAILTDAFQALSHEWNVRLGESVLARLHFVLHVDPHVPSPSDLDALQARIATATRAWVDDLRDTLVAARGEEEGLALLHVWGDAFPAAYQDDFGADEALADLSILRDLDVDGSLSARLDALDRQRADLKLFGSGPQPYLSEVLPTLTNMGVVVEDERPYDIEPRGLEPRWMKHFRLRVPAGAVGTGSASHLFEEALLAVREGRAEDDGFNRLVLLAGLSGREASLLRAYSRYLRQIGTRYSQTYIEDTLAAHPGVARSLVELFVTRLDPWNAGEQDTDRLVDQLEAAIDAVDTLDEDRILRSFLHLVRATLRTNWFQTGPDDEAKRSIVLKLDPARIRDAPRPRPMFEIFVTSPRVEGVHLRAGRVARGGIRWSDRREDFRTEILDLMKAQRVKNVVILPSGAKGGFVVKRPPAGRDQLAAEVEACYRELVSGMLDVTDNLVDGEVRPPPRVVRYDGHDPYLVVAADRGTAAFSDIANEIAGARGFWLGDAFASGGSTGYDHKRLGITARGAWVCIERRLLDLGIDIDTTDVTVVGIGDMSGDVFGNGMLRSRHIRLVAAFDHRHIFCDPDPDPDRSFAERKRLFSLPRSSWDDYDRSAIASGGGVFARTAKAIGLTPEMRTALGIEDEAEDITPNALVSHILRAPVDLFYNGGIGTFVKAMSEDNADVGDKTNDTVRVNGAELRCRVVGEGGNLGFTQRGRVEYALARGRIGTDAIDNSAGVDLSDHEVNLKILLDRVVSAGELTTDGRNTLLAEIADDVAQLVLRDNYRQSRALANASAQAAAMEDVHARFIRELERAGDLDREVEALPTDEELAERRTAGRGLTTPELAVLLAYAKITCSEDVLSSALPEDEDFVGVLHDYFPPAVRERYRAWIDGHPLRREIIATALVNGMVNRAGSTFAFRLGEETGATVDQIVRAHEAARAVFGQSDLWHAIEALDGRVAATTQVSMYLESRKMVERASRWLLRHRKRPLPVRSTCAHFRPRVERITEALPDLLVGSERDWYDEESKRLTDLGVPTDLAEHVALLDALHTALDITDLADATGRPAEEVAAQFCVVGGRLSIDWLRDRAVELPRDDRWRALSRRALLEDLDAEHRRVTGAILAATDPGFEPAHAFDVWAAENAADLDRVQAMVEAIRTHSVYDLATLSVVLREIRALQ
jgi:glutamate dehydrogenase